jgi:hypothetical protein
MPSISSVTATLSNASYSSVSAATQSIRFSKEIDCVDVSQSEIPPEKSPGWQNGLKKVLRWHSQCQVKLLQKQLQDPANASDAALAILNHQLDLKMSSSKRRALLNEISQAVWKCRDDSDRNIIAGVVLASLHLSPEDRLAFVGQDLINFPDAGIKTLAQQVASTADQDDATSLQALKAIQTLLHADLTNDFIELNDQNYLIGRPFKESMSIAVQDSIRFLSMPSAQER